MLRRRLRGLWDRRRWRSVWTALTADSLMGFAFWTDREGRPVREAVVAILDSDEARTAAIEFVETQLADALRQGLFDDMPDWSEGPVDLAAVYDPPASRLDDPRRQAASVDVLRSDTFLSVTASETAATRIMGTAVVLVESERDRARLLEVLERVPKVIAEIDLDRLQARYEWEIEVDEAGEDDPE
jgi:hypothetical protein